MTLVRKTMIIVGIASEFGGLLSCVFRLCLSVCVCRNILYRLALKSPLYIDTIEVNKIRDD